MDRPITKPSLALAVVILAAIWHFSTPSLNHVDASESDSFLGEHTQHAHTNAAPSATTSVFARASFANQSPFSVAELPPTTSNLTAPENEHARKQFEQLLRDYRFGGLDPAEKSQVKKALRHLMQDRVGRSFIVDTFFSSDEPQLAESLYGLIRDADLKDVALLESLIQRDNTIRVASFKTRVVDLIADLPRQQDVPYSAVIDAYLADTALNSDLELRNAATSQRIWYLANHQPNNIAVLNKYLVDSAPRVREEMYGLIESRIADQTLTGQAELARALNAALQTELLGISPEEKTRVSALLESLTAGSAPL